MARNLVNGQVPGMAGAAVTFASANGSGGNSFYNSGRTIVIIKNGSGSPITATFQTPATTLAGAIPDLVVTIPAAGEYVVGQMALALLNQADGSVYLDWSSATSVTFAVIEP